MQVSSSVAPGTYTLTLQAQGGGVTRTASLTVDVQAMSWTWRNPLPQGNPLNGVTFANGTFVAVGSDGTILTSPDGVTWIQRSSGTTNLLNGVTFANGTFVAVGRGGTILTSP